jgi:hypothetical protein
MGIDIEGIFINLVARVHRYVAEEWTDLTLYAPYEFPWRRDNSQSGLKIKPN